MANLCEFEIRVKGHIDNVLAVHRIINADYSYSDGKLEYCTDEHHFFRMTPYFSDIQKENDIATLLVCGDCAWSVASCMTENGYFKNLKNSVNFKGITLEQVSEKYKVTIEVYSSEPGIGFEEHYLYRNGVCEIDECVPFFKKWEFSI